MERYVNGFGSRDQAGIKKIIDGNQQVLFGQKNHIDKFQNILIITATNLREEDHKVHNILSFIHFPVL